MAIDTAAKRSQMLGFGSGDTLPIPDGTIAQADRQHLLWLYGGILAIVPSVGRSIYRPGTAVPRAIDRPGTAVPIAVYRPENSTPAEN